MLHYQLPLGLERADEWQAEVFRMTHTRRQPDVALLEDPSRSAVDGSRATGIQLDRRDAASCIDWLPLGRPGDHPRHS